MASRETSDPLACFKSLVEEGGSERGGQSDPEHDRKTPDLVFQSHRLADQLLVRDDQRADDLWLAADAPKALELQRPLPDDALKIVASGEKEDGIAA